MICCFSGTGNSRYVAQRIANAISQEHICDLNEYIKNNKSLEKEERIIFVTPTYAWRIPRIVENYIKSNAPFDNANAYFVMTCGGEIGNAGKYLELLCRSVGLNYMGVAQVLMPENYIAMFSAPEREEALRIVDASEKTIDGIIDVIKSDSAFAQSKVSVVDKLYSSIVNTVYYPLCVKDKSFYAKDSCISCGKCKQACPLNNIELIDGKPRWKGNCTHCMACICGCPTGAIEYGKKSVNQPRYHCPK